MFLPTPRPCRDRAWLLLKHAAADHHVDGKIEQTALLDEIDYERSFRRNDRRRDKKVYANRACRYRAPRLKSRSPLRSHILTSRFCHGSYRCGGSNAFVLAMIGKVKPMNNNRWRGLPFAMHLAANVRSKLLWKKMLAGAAASVRRRTG